MITKIFIITCHPYGQRNIDVIENCTASHFLLGFTLIISLILAYIHSKYITLPIPITWSIFTNSCGRHQHRIITTASLWGIYMSIEFFLGCLPFQLLLVSANPHLYGFGILTVWCAMFACIIITSIPFTIDQIFIKKRGIQNHTKTSISTDTATHVHSSTCLWIWITNIQYYTCTTYK